MQGKGNGVHQEIHVFQIMFHIHTILILIIQLVLHVKVEQS